ncbi:MAG: hypothetical protein VB131_09470 [Burkholderia gladioli]
MGRKQPSIQDALTYAKRILAQSWMGADEEPITQLESFNRATQAYQRKVLDAMKRGEQLAEDDAIHAELEKKRGAAIEAYTKYVEAIKTGRELETLMKYDSTDVLKSVVDRLENITGMRIYNEESPPFDPQNPVWRYKFNALSLPGRKLAGLVRMEEIFLRAIERGEQDDVVEVIVLDEAHIYGDEEGSILDKIAKEGRKFALMLVCASQSPIDFTDGFITSCGSKVALGIDESYYRQSATKMRVTEEALQWIKLQKSLLVQIKQKGDSKNDWKEVHPHCQRVTLARFGTKKMAHENRTCLAGAHAFTSARCVENPPPASHLIARNVLLTTNEHWQVPYPCIAVLVSWPGGQPRGMSA